MIVTSEVLRPDEFERLTGWAIKPEGACRGDVCIALPPTDGDLVDIRAFAERAGMPVVHDEAHGLWCLGPQGGGRALQSAAAPDLVLPRLDGTPFALRSLRGQKVFLLAWASW